MREILIKKVARKIEKKKLMKFWLAEKSLNLKCFVAELREKENKLKGEKSWVLLKVKKEN